MFELILFLETEPTEKIQSPCYSSWPCVWWGGGGGGVGVGDECK